MTLKKNKRAPYEWNTLAVNVLIFTDQSALLLPDIINKHNHSQPHDSIILHFHSCNIVVFTKTANMQKPVKSTQNDICVNSHMWASPGPHFTRNDTLTRAGLQGENSHSYTITAGNKLKAALHRQIQY